jgi:hypothetical protein
MAGRRTGNEPEVITMESRRILLVANQTAGGTELKREIRRRMSEGPCVFTLVVPSTPPQEHATWEEGEARDIARRRMESAVEEMRQMGADISGVVGDASPVLAINDVLIEQPCDEIILSTLPPGVSRWLKRDLPHRVEQRFGLPVTTVIGERQAASAR